MVDTLDAQFEWMKCAKCKQSLRKPVDPWIEAIGCICGYFTLVTK